VCVFVALTGASTGDVALVDAAENVEPPPKARLNGFLPPGVSSFFGTLLVGPPSVAVPSVFGTAPAGADDVTGAAGAASSPPPPPPRTNVETTNPSTATPMTIPPKTRNDLRTGGCADFDLLAMATSPILS
jgi:hypothetical protein